MLKFFLQLITLLSIVNCYASDAKEALSAKFSENEKVCHQKRVEANLKKLGVSLTSVKITQADDLCHHKNFCFMFKTLMPLEVNKYRVPRASDVTYCESGGIRRIDTHGNGQIVGVQRTCNSILSFAGNPGRLCSCDSVSPEKISLQKENKKFLLEIPALSTLYYSNDKVKEFRSSEAVNVHGIRLEKAEIYAIKNDMISLIKYDDSGFAVCDAERPAMAEEVDDILFRHGFKKNDFKDDFYYRSDCDYDDGDGDGSDQTAVKISFRATLAIDKKTDDLTAPKGTIIGFCRGTINRIKYMPVTFWGHACAPGVEFSYLSPSGEKGTIYSCKLEYDTDLGGVTLPSGIEISFDKKNILAFSSGVGEDAREPVIVGGVKLQNNRIYCIKNKKVVKFSDCERK